MNIYSCLISNLNIHKEAVNKGSRDLAMGLYRIPLKEKVDNLNTDILSYWIKRGVRKSRVREQR